MRHTIFTIGHSNKRVNELISLLKKNDIQALVDIRSIPYSRHAPQVNQENLERSIKKAGVEYLFMGEQLGGRPKDVDVRDDLGNYDYSKLAATEDFKEGLTRLLKESEEYNLCLLCSEEDPVRCHRGLLVSRELAKLGAEVRHIRHDGSVESQKDFERRIPPVQLCLFSER
ncbi:MAG: DUF488 domain-containing protein [Sedimentisphaerales bacterium]|nr:DUF488 domain-containing protein [Sedimentisphaerales bacterium]